MVCFFPINFSPATRRFPVVILALCWVCGLLSGTYFAFCADSSFFSLMRLTLSEPVSIVNLLVTQLLPVFFSVVAVLIHRRQLFYPIAFAEAFLLSFIGIGVMIGFGRAGWLPTLLLMFSGSLISCVVLWFWISYLEHPVSGVYRRLTLTAASVVLICALNYRFFLPFILELFSF